MMNIDIIKFDFSVIKAYDVFHGTLHFTDHITLNETDRKLLVLGIY